MSNLAPEFKLIRDAIKFANLAAGEGIYIDGIGPEDFLMDYSAETRFEDWDALEDHIIERLLGGHHHRSQP